MFMNVLDMQRLHDGVKVVGISQALFDEILEILRWQEKVTLGELTHPEIGRTIRIRKVIDGTKIRGAVKAPKTDEPSLH